MISLLICTYDKLVNLIKETKEDLQQAKIIEELMDDYDLGVIAQRKTAESTYIISRATHRVNNNFKIIFRFNQLY